MQTDKKTKTIIIALAVVIIVLAAVLTYGLYMGWLSNQQQLVYTAGYQKGASDAVVTIIQQSLTCSPNGVPLTVGNQTFTMVNVACYPAAK
jgi:flagellar basal body-associated protein FliL